MTRVRGSQRVYHAPHEPPRISLGLRELQCDVVADVLKSCSLQLVLARRIAVKFPRNGRTRENIWVADKFVKILKRNKGLRLCNKSMSL